MGIKLSEHRSIQVFVSGESESEKEDCKYLSPCDFELISIEHRRKLFGKVVPYQMAYNQKENSYNLQADYYIGLDWLVKGKRYIHIEPKVNQKLLEIYQKSIDQDELSEEENLSEDQSNLLIIEIASKDQGQQKKIDYLKMLLEVYASEIPKEKIGNLVEIYWKDPKAKIEQKDDYLTPFLVVQFLGLLKTIVRKGLKKSYYKIQENLQNRVKGKVLVARQIKQNIFKNRFTATYCEYQVFGENSLENQFLKKVFQFCNHYVQNQPKFFESTIGDISHTISYIRPAFEHIDDSLNENQLHNFKHNPFFKEYKEAIKIGNFILKQLGYNISTSSGKEIETPPFWIDMPRLFELYFYQNLLKDNPSDSNKIEYQLATHGNTLDFLIKDGENSIVMDTKYKLHYKQSHIHEDIRQVSGYARLRKVRRVCGLENADIHLNCLIVYPVLDEVEENFSIKNIQTQLTTANEIKAYHKVFKLGLKLPLINN